MRSLVALCASIPDPARCPTSRVEFIVADDGRWRSAVNTMHFDDSICDTTPAPEPGLHRVRGHICTVCSAAFASARALLSHSRRKHGTRVPQREYAHADGRCPVCGTTFGSRTRLLRHLCDSRRDKCWTAIQAEPDSYPRLAAAALVALDLRDRTARRDAFRAGHSYPIAVGPARNAAGKLNGHVQR